MVVMYRWNLTFLDVLAPLDRFNLGMMNGVITELLDDQYCNQYDVMGHWPCLK